MAMRLRVNYALAGVVIFHDAKPVFLSDIGKANEAVVIMNVFYTPSRYSDISTQIL